MQFDRSVLLLDLVPFVAFVAVFLLFWGAIYLAIPLIRRALNFAVRPLARVSTRWSWVGRFLGEGSPWRAYLPVVLVVLAGVILTIAVGDSFLDTAELVHANSAALQTTDVRVHDWAVHRRADAVTFFFVTMTNAGGPFGDAALVIVSAAILLFRRRLRWLAYLVITAGGGALLNLQLKHFFTRARPDVADALRAAHGYSFPSGHAMGATVVYGALSYLAFRAITRWSWRAAAVAFTLTMILAVASSRVYLGVHWVSDVIAGVTAGTTWVISTTVAYETLRRIRLVRRVRVPLPAQMPG